MINSSNSTGILIVAGFSCAGKSSYIRHIVTRYAKFQNATPVYEYMFRKQLFRKQLRDNLAPGDIFHLDLSAVKDSATIQSQALVSSHPLHRKMINLDYQVTVDFLVAPTNEIYRRISRRNHVGLGWRNDNSKGKYPKVSKSLTLHATELSLRYDAWRTFFEGFGYHCRYFHSTRGRFLPLSNWSEAEYILK